ncbi:hypothetical protein SAMN05192554_10782 [Haloarchaeobius iranensis]|uniref:Uncharacterized protein n=2 Tax=Haloarchaeobius iranensis TaxID=996166 RepID=A0A1G9VZK0_9EURY|nr:hypothetical protein SAMN05192554_10782 [Haloarchaeobius iranensis]
MTVARGGIVVAKRLDVDSLPLPAVSYELRSEREERTEVTLVEQLPATVEPDRVGYHPEYGGDGWTCYDGGELVWRGELAPGESRRVVLAVWLDAPETALSLLTPPTVESVRTVGRDADPQVLDETLLTGAGSGAGTSAVAEHVPDGAFRREEGTIPTLAELPDPGDGLDAPPRAVVNEAADAIVGGGSDADHDRYYHLRLSVDSADRGAREVSVLEDLTNALSVLYADADDRDGGAWRVLDVAIGTNWQAERIVTALGDDHRVSGLVVTELTGAVAARAARPESADPNPDEFAATVFESASPTAEEGSDAATPGPASTDSPDPVEPATALADSDAPVVAEGTVDDDASTVDPTGPGEPGDFVPEPVSPGGSTDEDEFGTRDGAFEPDDLGTDGDSDTGDGFGVDGGFGSSEEFTFDDEDGTDAGLGADAGSTPDSDEPTDAMVAFTELQRETERADVDELDAELAGMVLSPTGSEEYTIGKLLEDIDDDHELSSV